MPRIKTVLGVYRALRRKEIGCRDDLIKMLTLQLHADAIRDYLKRRLQRIEELRVLDDIARRTIA